MTFTISKISEKITTRLRSDYCRHAFGNLNDSVLTKQDTQYFQSRENGIQNLPKKAWRLPVLVKSQRKLFVMTQLHPGMKGDTSDCLMSPSVDIHDDRQVGNTAHHYESEKRNVYNYGRRARRLVNMSFSILLQTKYYLI